MLTKALAQYFNATFSPSYDVKWGEDVGNGTFNGLLGRIQRSEIDMTGIGSCLVRPSQYLLPSRVAGSPLFCVIARLHIMNCVSMTTPAAGFFIFKQPPLSYVANIFVLPFETSLWLTDIALLAVSAVFIYAVVQWEWKILRETRTDPDYDMMLPSVLDSVLFTIGAVSQQGYSTEPKSGAGKVVILTLFLAILFLFTAYSANTVVLFQSTATHIKTLQDLYDSRMELGVDDKLYFRYWFNNTFGKVHRKIYLDRVVPPGKRENFFPLEYGVERMRREYFAFHIDSVREQARELLEYFWSFLPQFGTFSNILSDFRTFSKLSEQTGSF